MNQPETSLPPEFSRLIDTRHSDAQGTQKLKASPQERIALANRFDLVAVHRLEANLQLETDGTATNVTGKLQADIVQSCAISGEDLSVMVREQLTLRFVAAQTSGKTDEEIELDESQLDEIPYSGDEFDLGEALAQSLALAIDPYAAGPDAQRAREEAGLLNKEAAGPFAALAALKDSKKD